MATEFKFPDVGEGIAEGELVRWRVKEGDAVREHDVIADMETDKAIVEIPAPQDGVILKLHHQPGDTVQVGETLVTIGERGEKAAVGGVPAMAQQKKSVSVVGQLEEAEEETGPIAATRAASAPREESGKPVLPVVRRLAKELGVNIEEITGTGKDGRITENDVRNATAEHGSEEEKVTSIKVTKKYDFYGYVDRVALKGIRKAIAANMVRSHSTAVHVTHFEEADVTDLAAHREKEKGNAAKQGVKLTYLPFIIKAVVEALKNHPYLNATMEEDEIVLKKYYNIGFAVDADDGLIVPNIKRAEIKSIMQTAKEIEALTAKIKSRSFDISETRGGTFTITNVGSIGGIFATPIINPPESAILATGAIREKPVVRGGKIEIRKMMPLSLSFDHRILDGAEAARFTAELKNYLEDMDFFLMEKTGE
ncbi:MAG: 2-oxo acid dehydrogenase subunit E2 [Candidatus Aenigmarchaeota archaeon]|nr:2-oxo acid dehydrogenase subunit E2 [Candidatus Aenigmarchaeota archaeon]